jgi:hypothetical protein
VTRSLISLLLFVATPGIAQSLRLVPSDFDLGRLSVQPRPSPKEPIIVPQFVERFEPDGVRVRQRGILIGQQIAPNVTVGLGFVERKNRRSGFYPTQPDGNARRSGKASTVLIVRF